MGEGDSPLISIGDACRGVSGNGRYSVSEQRLDVSIERRGVDGVVEDVEGRWDVDAEARPLSEGVTTRFDGDFERIGLEARWRGTIVDDFDEFLTSWDFGVGVSGGASPSLRDLIGMTDCRGGSRCNEGVDGDAGNAWCAFDDR